MKEVVNRQRMSWLLLGCVGVIYLFSVSSITKVIPSYYIKYAIIPLLWLGICGLIYWWLPRVHPQKRMRWKEEVCLWAIFAATVLLAIEIMMGMVVSGFGETPYDVSLSGIVHNALYLLPALVGRELIRAYTLGTLCKSGANKRLFWLITGIMAMTQMNFAGWATVGNLETLTMFITKNIAPVICENILLSYLVSYGGAMPAIIYTGIGLGFHWLSPLLPMLGWFEKGVVGIVVPLITLTVVQHLYGRLTKTLKLKDAKEEKIGGWLVTLALSVLFIWFVIGVFPIYPSVVATGSMEPMIKPGDVVLVHKLQEEEELYALKEGDVVHFKRDQIVITHRIIEVIVDDLGNHSYRTKGDNNSAEDQRVVLPNEIIGTVKSVIPKIGILTLWIKSTPTDTVEDVVF